MDTLLWIVPKVLTVLTVITDVLIVLFLVTLPFSMVIRPLLGLRNKILNLVRPYARILAFVIALVSMLGSLFYSEVAHYTPCILCGYQRIAMYPQVFLLGMAILKNDSKISDYIMMLSGIGALISSYHYYIQRGGETFLPCSAIGYSVDCSQRFSMEYGYVTIPIMALSAFLAIIILMILVKTDKRHN